MNVFQKICKKCGKIKSFSSKRCYNKSKPDNEYFCKSCALSMTHTGKIISDEHKQKLKDFHMGLKASEETKKKLSDLKKGKNNSCFGRLGSLHPMYGKSGPLSPTFGMTAWNKGKINVYSEETKKKMSQAKTGKYNGKNNPNYGNHTPLSKDHIRKIRLSHIKRVELLKNNGFRLKPNFNPKACQIIEEYGKQNGYNFRHAMNGGEFYIEELGYWVDGYDKKQNVVIDYFENNKHHYDENGNIKSKDRLRIEEIKKYLGCRFILLEEKNNKT